MEARGHNAVNQSGVVRREVAPPWRSMVDIVPACTDFLFDLVEAEVLLDEAG